ncbi:hypothetical protein PYW07_009739 [Mythimna separata]|uniref:Uncharacterized protein n=1 Tax=Mythimna separata TaxID=271217 RepID=A0AAD8DMJ0_MYTSE|nr:hypothetical protein PYW07_009739 [Mythimna separata]
MPKINEFLESQNNDELENQKAYEPPKVEAVERSVLVKRIIPHGYKTGEYEYDSKLNTVFKPLARYHIQNTEEEHIKSLLKQKEKEQKEKDRYDKDLVVLVQKIEKKNDLLNQIQKILGQNVKVKNVDKFTKLDKILGGLGKDSLGQSRQQSTYDIKNTLLDQIQMYLNQKNLNKFKSVDKVLDGLGKDSLVALRQQQSAHNYDPFAYGSLPPNMMGPSSKEESAEKKVVPSYPFWEYWTYHKNIAQDRCPDNLIRIGNMCINGIGHRRSGGHRNIKKSHHGKRRHSIRAARQKHLYGK